MKFYIIGDRELVLAFKLTGIDGCVAEGREEVLSEFHRITGHGATPVDEVPRVLILTESASSVIDEEVLAWQKTGQYPLIVEIPPLSGHIPGRPTLTQAICAAVGVQV